MFSLNLISIARWMMATLTIISTVMLIDNFILKSPHACCRNIYYGRTLWCLMFILGWIWKVFMQFSRWIRNNSQGVYVDRAVGRLCGSNWFFLFFLSEQCLLEWRTRGRVINTIGQNVVKTNLIKSRRSFCYPVWLKKLYKKTFNRFRCFVSRENNVKIYRLRSIRLSGLVTF